MSTRSIIVVTGKKKTIRIYKHCDGYPTSNLPIIADAVAQPDAYATKGAVSKIEKKLGIKVDTVKSLAFAICKEAEFKPENAIEDEFEGALKPEHLGGQQDLEWIYVVDVDAKTVNVYGGGYTGCAPQTAYKQGVVDPLSYANKMREEYQERERKDIQKAMDAVEATGFKLNPKGGKAPRKNKRAELTK